MSKVVFVGNVPYNMAEDQLIDVFKSVGQVVGLRLVFDRDTGKPKGYGFCEFADHETAASAVRNLNGYEIGGRPLRIDLADSDPFLEGKTTVRGEIIDGGETRAQWRERNERERHDRDRYGDHHDRLGRSNDPNAFLQHLPKGVPLPHGSNALDAISHVLATTDPGQILEVLAQMKAFIITHPEHARALLVAHPQLGYALFQALLLHKIVDPAILQRMLAATGATIPPATSAPPPTQPSHPAPPSYMSTPALPPGSMYAPPMPPAPTPMQHPAPPVPPPSMYGQPPPQMPPYYRGPPPPAPPPVAAHPQQMPPAHMPPPVMHSQQPAPPRLPDLDQAQRDILMQVLNLTQEQLNTLPPSERDPILQLRRQFGVDT
ncbi:hypothetical protein BD309DRAFT_972229 [Dichomitus squalens]|uniref:Uncharacterized protein n=2 Tax=Dichomitus squalens TaxID=114155 RepID=A0A4Q9Q7D6_9APHY|nr:uncharacterized protein DICSQDRAFT_154995 [Dichomitus squalens LYAD-421 SS1]EJF61815.1 hypothetical protein DICSQDRAFT_154995 [Dichomitus squalens LYAD-421 SS1]TBU38300.1 hypothetical protein BD309DRAFT_972229 [Dichomitus squalens]TBU63412.1 hypothetical protein BD310DRAFT_916296 [Dichomitus squalens]